MNLKIPPLSDREDDILFLAQYFLDRYSREFGRGLLTFTAKAELELQQHGWPGNVRELEHRIQKAVLMSTGNLVDAVDLELGEVESPKQVSLREARQEADRHSIQDALRLTGGNISMAAKVLGISRPSLHALLTKLQIKAQDYKPHMAREKE